MNIIQRFQVGIRANNIINTCTLKKLSDKQKDLKKTA